MCVCNSSIGFETPTLETQRVLFVHIAFVSEACTRSGVADCCFEISLNRSLDTVTVSIRSWGANYPHSEFHHPQEPAGLLTAALSLPVAYRNVM